MKKIIKLLKEHVKEDFQAAYYAIIVIFLAGSIAFNYAINLENGVIDVYQNRAIRMVWYFLLYAPPFYFTCGLISYFKKDTSFWKSSRFWLFSLFGLAVLSVDRGFPFYYQIVALFKPSYQEFVWMFKVLNHALPFLLQCLPLFLFYKILDKQKSGFYGLTTPGDIRPYITLLLLVTPLIFLASLQKSFTNYYPVYKGSPVAELWDWPEFLPAFIFEFFYGADFLNVELLFRGFFVIGMAQVLGRNSVMPMVVIYCFLHFGKPPGETISSIFGGFILGTIALYTRSIWGGVMIHVGVALLMELMAYLSKQFWSA